MWNPFRRDPQPIPVPAAAPPPSPEADPERYRGRPLLMLLENYVLAAIGELPAERSAGVGAIVQRMWGGDQDWMATLRRQLHLEDALDASLREMWTRNQRIARDNRVELHPVQFAKMVADQNFAHLISAAG
jgi:hypothetical protein